jgi:acylphosphatase
MPSNAPPRFKPSLPVAAPVHLSIHGRVQGVGFRDALSLQALRHGVDGWVRNRRDGSVEAVIQGDARAVETLIRWAHHGPPAARVDQVDARPANADEATAVQPGFRRLPTA